MSYGMYGMDPSMMDPSLFQDALPQMQGAQVAQAYPMPQMTIPLNDIMNPPTPNQHNFQSLKDSLNLQNGGNEEAAKKDDWYRYGVLASLGGSAGAALGSMFKRRPAPPPVAPQQAGWQGRATADPQLAYLASTRKKRG